MSRHPSPAEMRPGRIGALPKLPVFLELAGRCAVVAAQGPGAVWKAELLAAAGARVEVFAEHPSPELLALAGPHPQTGTIRLVPRRWVPADLEGAAIAVGDFEAEDEARAFADAARARRIPVNVIDRPGFCDFQFGAIVNRAPVVVAISTNGGAPILGQAIRRRIEAILPASLGAWGAAAEAFRDRLAGMLPMRPARRVFWEAFVDRAFGAKAGPRPCELERLADEIQAGEAAGHAGIELVSLSSDDPELLTLRAVRTLQAADVIVHDAAVPPAVLELGRREARRIAVGDGHEAFDGEDVGDLLSRLAAGGARVVRLEAAFSAPERGGSQDGSGADRIPASRREARLSAGTPVPA